MEGIKIFERQEFGQVRVVDVNGEPWFVAKDVCDCLELDLASGARGLDDDEKGLHTMQTPGGEQEMLIIEKSKDFRGVEMTATANVKVL